MHCDDRNSDSSRLERLEESHLFLERQVEQLGESVTELSERLTNLTKRLANLESRMESLGAKDAPSESDDSSDSDPS